MKQCVRLKSLFLTMSGLILPALLPHQAIAATIKTFSAQTPVISQDFNDNFSFLYNKLGEVTRSLLAGSTRFLRQTKYSTSPSTLPCIPPRDGMIALTSLNTHCICAAAHLPYRWVSLSDPSSSCQWGKSGSLFPLRTTGSGTYSSVSLKVNGTRPIRFWGLRPQVSSFSSVFSPRTLIPSRSRVIHVALGMYARCVLRATKDLKNQVECFGRADYGFGDNTSASDTTVRPRLIGKKVFFAGDPTIYEVQGGEGHFCARHSSGMSCWGRSDYYQAGTSATTYLSPNPITGLSPLPLKMDVGNNTSGAYLGGTSVRVWAFLGGTSGGGNSASNYSSPVAVSSLAGTEVIQMIGGDAYHCLLHSNGQVGCFGVNSHGQLGNGNNTWSGTTLQVTRIQNVVEISGNLYGACALTQQGTVFCWGYNGYTTVGDGTATDRSTPRRVKRLKNRAIRLFGGVFHNCALLIDGRQQCWGSSASGQLGGVGVGSSYW